VGDALEVVALFYRAVVVRKHLAPCIINNKDIIQIFNIIFKRRLSFFLAYSCATFTGNWVFLFSPTKKKEWL
jgi:hypothetical protein